MPDLELLKQIHFLRPEWLILFIPYLFVLFIKNKKTKEKGGMHFPPHLMKALNVNKKTWKSNLPFKLLVVILSLGIIVVSGFSWKKVASPFGENKSNLVIVLDSSKSMLETDLAPSRLERSKQKINDLLEARIGGRSALIVYSGSAHVVMPLTEDIEVFKPFLDAVDPKIMPKKGKFAEKALKLIDKLSENTKDPLTILLVTDGLGNNTLSLFNQAFKNKNDQLLVLGAGNLNNPSDLPFEENKLKDLSSSVNGSYISITVDNSDIEKILSKTESHMQLNTDSSLPWEDAGYYLLFVLSFLFLFWFRKGWVVQWIFAGVMVFTTLTPNTAMANESISLSNIWLTTQQQGYIAYNNEKYLEAAVLYEDPFWIGMSYYKAKNYKKAHSFFLRVDNIEGMIYAANSLANAREYLLARTMYTEILKIDPENEVVLFNRKIIQDLIDAVNLMSESQANTENEVSKDLGDEPQTGDGAEEQVSKAQLKVEFITAEELMQDEELNKKWMERVQANPSIFLYNKFQRQLQKEEDGE